MTGNNQQQTSLLPRRNRNAVARPNRLHYGNSLAETAPEDARDRSHASRSLLFQTTGLCHGRGHAVGADHLGGALGLSCRSPQRSLRNRPVRASHVGAGTSRCALGGGRFPDFSVRPIRYISISCRQSGGPAAHSRAARRVGVKASRN